ncbi:alpha/beta hydrolase [Tsukamurella sp. NPDC003166]|uniref:alpha/beta hydrolase n=1 Tax=Tsukamurella sp. NPDC003166 TaxID=3154444 RepID=UPI0033B70BD9
MSAETTRTTIADGTVRDTPLRDLYQDWSALIATGKLDMRLFRSLFDEWHKPTVEPEGVTYKEESVGGVPGIWALPVDADPARVLIFLHGGGFAVGSAASHRKLAAHLAKAARARAFVADYRLAPEHQHPAQVDDGIAIFSALLAAGVDARNISTVGDSAGANLALAVPLALRERGLPLPGHVVALSPWLDMENQGGTLFTHTAGDALNKGPELMEMMIQGVLGDHTSRRHPLANPLYADFAGFPPLYIDVGGAESLLDHATRLADRAQEAGVDVTLEIAEGQQHVYPLLAGRDDEVDAEIARIGTWLNT